MLTDTNALDLGASTISGTLGVNTTGNITQSGALSVSGLTTLAAAGATSDITLSTATNDFSTVAVSSGRNVTLTDANALILGASTISGTLGVTTTGNHHPERGPVGQRAHHPGGRGGHQRHHPEHGHQRLQHRGGELRTQRLPDGRQRPDPGGLHRQRHPGGEHHRDHHPERGAVGQRGSPPWRPGAANDITLSNATNDFSTVAVSHRGNVVLTDANAIDLGASTVSGTLSVTAGGAITDSGNLSVTGASSFTVPNATSITLDSAGNSFGGTVSFLASAGTIQDVTVVDTTPLDLQALTLLGNLSVTATGITQSGAFVVPGTTTLSAGAANDITLNNAANNFGTVAVSSSGSNVSLADTNAIDPGHLHHQRHLGGAPPPGPSPRAGRCRSLV